MSICVGKGIGYMDYGTRTYVNIYILYTLCWSIKRNIDKMYADENIVYLS